MTEGTLFRHKMLFEYSVLIIGPKEGKYFPATVTYALDRTIDRYMYFSKAELEAFYDQIESPSVKLNILLGSYD